MPEVCLVDGFGRPRLVTLPEKRPLPEVIPVDVIDPRRGPAFQVEFVRSDEYCAVGVAIYRQRDTGRPPIRTAYYPKLLASRYEGTSAPG